MPVVIDAARSIWVQHTLRLADRPRFQAALKETGQQGLSSDLPVQTVGLCRYTAAPIPVSAALCGHVVSLPMHPYLDEAAQNRVIAAVLANAG